MRSDRIAVVDVETTGLFPWRSDRIVELAIVVISPNGQILFEYDTLLNPERDIGPSHIHQIHAADVFHAPIFHDVAGDVLQILSSVNVIAGHNIVFDRNFIAREYARIGIQFPEIPFLCTYQLLGRSLAGCCTEFGVEFDGIAHRALTDARVTAKLVNLLCADNPDMLDKYRIEHTIDWPELAVKQTPCISREQSKQILNKPPRFLERLTAKIHHDVDADELNVLAYLALIDRILEDRIIDNNEEDALVDAALEWELTSTQIIEAHRSYIRNLAVLALEDGIISSAERQDLHNVARLLGQDESELDSILETAAAQLNKARTKVVQKECSSELVGSRVCFTGELQSTINGQLLNRQINEHPKPHRQFWDA